MKHRLAQHQRMLQKMSLTPQMRQSLLLLGMPIKELNEYIDEVLEKNPCLKKEYIAKSQSKTRTENTAPFQETPVVQAENPRLALLSQARMMDMSESELGIAEYLIYELDENGYITVNMQEAAGDLGVDAREVDEVLGYIQSMEPAGIGARDIRECLQLQLKRLNKADSIEYRIVTDLLNELAAGDTENISRELKIDRKRAVQAIENIKKLNPRPASTMLARTATPVIPDIVASIKKNKVELGLNREWVPHLRLYNPYEDKLEIIKDPEVKKYLKDNMNAAKGLIDNLKRREETLCKVASYILDHQIGALGEGKHDIKSLTRKDVAKALNLHPSTISRTVYQKYIQIENDVLPLNTFLSKGVAKHNGEVISKVAIKKRIQALVKHEDKTGPLSDEEIKKDLHREGIKIERRTVAKYRNALRILPAYLRKKAK